MECKVENLGKFVVLWRKGDRILSAGKLLVRKDGKVKVTEKYGLKISDIEESDVGDYVCRIRTKIPKGIYHPKRPSDNTFNDKLHDTLENLSKEHKIMLSLGDFN